MDYRALTKRITDAFPDLSPQLQQAARHVVDRPDDVALLSMRSLALAADVTPSTMVRLAQSLGYEGYNEFRELFQQRLRVGPSGYVERARDLQTRGMAGVYGLMKEVFEHHVGNLRETFGRGEAACRPRVARQGLSACFVEPALADLERRGVVMRMRRRLRSVSFADDRLAEISFADGESVALDADDAAVLAIKNESTRRTIQAITIFIWPALALAFGGFAWWTRRR